MLAQQAEHGVAQGGEGLRGGAGADLTGILAQRHIAHVVQPMLDVAVLSDQAQQPVGRHVGAQTRQEVAHQMAACLARAPHTCVTPLSSRSTCRAPTQPNATR